MAGRVDQRFAAALAALLGGELVSVRRLGEEVIGLELEDGRRLVAKGVARQSLPSWEPGRPWAELVALDALSAAGAPVPKVVAADLEHGWLVTEFVSGDVFEAACSSRPGDAFSSLARGLIRLEDSFAAEWEHLQNWAVPGLQESRDLAAPIVQFLDDPAQGAWAELTSEAMTPGAFRQGPLDVRAANVVWGDGVTFLDMASYGYDVTEKRLSAYAQRAGKHPATMLDEAAYADYAAFRGEGAAIRLAYYDLLFWGIGLMRLLAALRQPRSKAARLLTTRWGDPAELVPEFEAMWTRRRVPDARVERVRLGLRPMQEACRR